MLNLRPCSPLCLVKTISLLAIGLTAVALQCSAQDAPVVPPSVSTSPPSPTTGVSAIEAKEAQDTASATQDAARLERRRIVSELDAKVLNAKRSFGVSIEILPVLERCSPLDAPVPDCKIAASEASAELDRRMSRAIALKAATPLPSREPINVTIIENRDTYLVNAKRVVVRPNSTPEVERSPAPQPTTPNRFLSEKERWLPQFRYPQGLKPTHGAANQ